MLDLFQRPFDGLFVDFFHVTEKLIIQLLRRAEQPDRICENYRGEVVPPTEQSHVCVRLIRESSKMLVALISFDAERRLIVLLLLQRVEVAHVPQWLFSEALRAQITI